MLRVGKLRGRHPAAILFAANLSLLQRRSAVQEQRQAAPRLQGQPLHREALAQPQVIQARPRAQPQELLGCFPADQVRLSREHQQVVHSFPRRQRELLSQWGLLVHHPHF